MEILDSVRRSKPRLFPNCRIAQKSKPFWIKLGQGGQIPVAWESRVDDLGFESSDSKEVCRKDDLVCIGVECGCQRMNVLRRKKLM